MIPDAQMSTLQARFQDPSSKPVLAITPCSDSDSSDCLIAKAAVDTKVINNANVLFKR